MSAVLGKVVAITGGARGIGYETARELVARGAKVALGDIDQSRLREAALELGIDTFRPLDVTDPGSINALLDVVEQDLGELDVFINNAGVQPTGRAVDEDDTLTRRTVEINLLGVVYGTKSALRRMLPRGRGHIINTASLAGEMTIPGLATYCATKAAVIAYTESTRLEYRDSGVRISGLRPTFTNTELIAGTPGVTGFRNAEPGDIARATVRLIDDPKPFVRVTRSAGAAVAAMKFVPGRLMERMSGVLGGDSLFLDKVDAQARETYLARIRGN